MLDEAFKALQQYDWGTDRAPLAPIDDAVVAAHSNSETRKDLETRLVAALKSKISRDAKDYVCRKLRVVGTAACVPALAELLGDPDHAHMARYALQCIPAAEAGKALRDALPTLSGNLKIGVIGSIGDRRDRSAVEALAHSLTDNDVAVARAAASALGTIGGAEAAAALASARPAADAREAVIDARLACAEALLADNQTAAAQAIYQSLATGGQQKLVRLAATRGMLACAAKNA